MDNPDSFKAGFVALLGRPNVGKSTLLNALLGTKLSIVSPKPQTTRHRILGLLSGKGHQACFLDTPGLLDSAHDLLQTSLIQASRRAAREDADILLVLVEPQPPDPSFLEHLGRLTAGERPLLLVLNKADLEPDREKLAAAAAAYAPLKPARTFVVSALKGEGVDALRSEIIRLLPPSPPYYDPSQLSDRWERFFVSEIIREGLFELYQQEIPHACAVDIEDFKEKPGRKDLIRATIYCERPTQKGILLGKKGRALEALSERSLKAIEKFLGRRVELELWIKVRPDWRKDPAALKQFGYAS